MDKKKEARRHQEDMALNRGLLWVGAAVVLEALLLLVNRYFINYRLSEADTAILFSNILKVIRLAGIPLALVCLVFALLRFRKGLSATLPTALACAGGALVICAHVALSFHESGMRMLFLLVPAWAGLALVYYLYHREFFLAACGVGLSIVGLWFVRYGDGPNLESILTLAGIVVLAAITLWLKKSQGAVARADGSQVQVISKNASYLMILSSCLVSLAAVVCGMVLGGGFAYYLIFIMVAWLFALLVYYTVKLM